MNRTITPEFAEILGLLCAEGSHVVSYSTYWRIDRGKVRLCRNDRSERIEFYNKDKKLILHYQNLLFKEFNYTTKVTKHGKVNIGNRHVINAIINQTELGHLKWQVPETVITGEIAVKIAFIRGYFDGDGTVSNAIRMFSCNKEGLEKVSHLLQNVGIESNWQKPMLNGKRKPLYVIHVSQNQRESFLNLIQPVSKRDKRISSNAEVSQREILLTL